MNSSELRQKYLEFFKKQGHAIIPSASLIPENDPTVLFTTAGMHPLVPYLLGQKHPEGTRICDAQKCIRTGDIDEVGDNRHLTFFEMLGNWSLGDYFKKEAIAWSFEFLTSKEWLNLDPRRLYITVFAGENDVAIDEESIEAWREQFKSVGISAEVSKTGRWDNENVRIFALGKDDNWWGLATGGPCGPCTEMFYDTNPGVGFELKNFQQLVNDFRFIEIWNDVFMQFNKKPDGSLEKLDRPNVDTGMGLERTLVVLNGKTNVYETDVFLPIISKILFLAGVVYDSENIPLSVYPQGVTGSNLNKNESVMSVRIIADHIRAAVFLIADGVVPSNKDRGYILRRLIRRMITRGKRIGINKIGSENFLAELSEVVVKQYSSHYPELEKNYKNIIEELNKEETKFRETLNAGIKKIEEYVLSKESNSKFAEADRSDFESKSEDYINLISGKDAFDLYQSYGFPPELLNEELARFGMGYHKDEFRKEAQKHQELSRTANAGTFKGGLADNSEATTKLHTAAHLMLAGLRKFLGDSVQQKGSNITAERLRFDVSYKEKITPEILKQVEDFVNSAISKDLPVICKEMSLDQAKEINATGVFEHKYGERVKVYFVGENENNVSKEICGGPHVEHTGILGKFKIVKEESSSAGVRRIKAILK